MSWCWEKTRRVKGREGSVKEEREKSFEGKSRKVKNTLGMLALADLIFI